MNSEIDINKLFNTSPSVQPVKKSYLTIALGVIIFIIFILVIVVGWLWYGENKKAKELKTKIADLSSGGNGSKVKVTNSGSTSTGTGSTGVTLGTGGVTVTSSGTNVTPGVLPNNSSNITVPPKIIQSACPKGMVCVQGGDKSFVLVWKSIASVSNGYDLFIYRIGEETIPDANDLTQWLYVAIISPNSSFIQQGWSSNITSLIYFKFDYNDGSCLEYNIGSFNSTTTTTCNNTLPGQTFLANNSTNTNAVVYGIGSWMNYTGSSTVGQFDWLFPGTPPPILTGGLNPSTPYSNIIEINFTGTSGTNISSLMQGMKTISDADTLFSSTFQIDFNSIFNGFDASSLSFTNT